MERHLSLAVMLDAVHGYGNLVVERDDRGPRFWFVPHQVGLLSDSTERRISPWLLPDTVFGVGLNDTARAAWWQPFWDAWCRAEPSRRRRQAYFEERLARQREMLCS